MDFRAIFELADTEQSACSRPAHEAATLWKRLEGTMTRKIIRSIIPVCFLSTAILIFGVNDNLAYAKQTRTSVACGNAIKKQCSGVPVQANNVFECLQKSQDKLPKRCGALALNVIRTCDRDGSRLCQGVVAGSQGNCRLPDHRQEYGFLAMQCGSRCRRPALTRSGCLSLALMLAR
jgi:hypothetical protein